MKNKRSKMVLDVSFAVEHKIGPHSLFLLAVAKHQLLCQ